MLLGCGGSGAPTNSTVIAMWFPSGVKSPAWKALECFAMQPVRRGFIDVHAPVLFGETGGRGSSIISITSG